MMVQRNIGTDNCNLNGGQQKGGTFGAALPISF